MDVLDHNFFASQIVVAPVLAIVCLAFGRVTVAQFVNIQPFFNSSQIFGIFLGVMGSKFMMFLKMKKKKDEKYTPVWNYVREKKKMLLKE